MSSSDGARRPGALPRVEFVPRAETNDGADAVSLAGSYGLRADPWQAHVIEGWLGYRLDGKFSSPRCGLAVPRQNGKNGVLEIRELFGMVMLAERILHTAHEVKTARKAFARLLEFFDNPRQFPELTRMVKEIRKTNGQEAIVLHNGGSIEFVARSKGSGRGFSVDVLVCDEAQELSEEELAALYPTVSASPNPQLILTGTPPGPKANGEVFTRTRTAGVEGQDARLCWHEWSCLPDCDLDDPAEHAASNPARGIRLDVETILDERATFDDETFARERLGVWFPSDDGGWEVISELAWTSRFDFESEAVDPVAFGFDITPERTAGAIAISGRSKSGLEHVEVIASEDGVDWIVEVLVRAGMLNKHNAVVTDATGPAAALIPALERRGVKVTALAAQDVARACGGFVDSVNEERLAHRGDGPLRLAVAAATKATAGDAYRFSRKDATVNIAPLYAATFARHGHVTAPPTRTFWGAVA